MEWYSVHYINVVVPLIAALVEHMKANPFGLVVDGSSGTGVEKLKHLTVRISTSKGAKF